MSDAFLGPGLDFGTAFIDQVIMANANDTRYIDGDALWRGVYGFYQLQRTVGYRIPITGDIQLPDESHTGPALFRDSEGGVTFIGSTLCGDDVQPSKIVPRWPLSCHYASDSCEISHIRRYSLLPFDSKAMEWAFTLAGGIPEGRVPIEGGYETTGERLYHAIGNYDGAYIPGKTGPHFRGMYLTHGGNAYFIGGDYLILCWK